MHNHILSIHFSKVFLYSSLCKPPSPPLHTHNKRPPYNRSPSGIEAQSHVYNFSDIIEAQLIRNMIKQ